MHHNRNYISFGTADLSRLDIGLAQTTGLPTVLWYIYFDMSIGAGPVPAQFQMLINRSPTFTDTAWKHLVISYQPGSFACYFNGQNVYQTNVTVNIFPVAQAALNRHWWDNGSSSSARMSATYQNVRIYNRALSDNEVSQLYSHELLTGILNATQGTNTTGIALSFLTKNNAIYYVQSSANLITWSNLDGPFLGNGTIFKKHILQLIRANFSIGLA